MVNNIHNNIINAAVGAVHMHWGSHGDAQNIDEEKKGSVAISANKGWW